MYADNKTGLEKEYSRIKSILSNLKVGATVLESDYRNIFYKFEGAFTFASGSQAILHLLKQVNIEQDIVTILATFQSIKGEERRKSFKNLNY